MNIRWQLFFPAGVVQDEPDEDGSIRNARQGAIAIHLTDRLPGSVDLRKPWQRVDMFDPETPWKVAWRPIFYRTRYMDLNAAPGTEGKGLSAVVFGRAREGEDKIDSQLWAWLPGMGATVIGCPARYIDPSMIELQTMQPTG